MSNIFNYFDKVILAAAVEQATKERIFDKDKLNELFNTQYSEAYKMAKQGHIIYRGSRVYDYSEKMLGLIYTPKERVSENTSNVYTKLLSDIFKSWQKFPKRNKSVIASFDINKAADYAEDQGLGLYVVLPKNGATIGICPESDIFDSFTNFPMNVYDAGDFNETLIFVLYAFLKIDEEHIKKIFKSSNEDVLNIFNQFDKQFELLINEAFFKKNIKTDDKDLIHEFFYNKFENIFNKRAHNLVKDYINFYISKNRQSSLLEFLEIKYFNPVKENFKIQKIKNLVTNNYSEVWFEGSCIFIPLKIWETLNHDF